jgi:hypothetical protein
MSGSPYFAGVAAQTVPAYQLPPQTYRHRKIEAESVGATHSFRQNGLLEDANWSNRCSIY